MISGATQLVNKPPTWDKMASVVSCVRPASGCVLSIIIPIISYRYINITAIFLFEMKHLLAQGTFSRAACRRQRQPPQRGDGFFQLRAPRVAVIEADAMAKRARGGKDGAGRDADAGRQRAAVQGQRID